MTQSQYHSKIPPFVQSNLSEVGRAIPFDLDVPKRPCHVIIHFANGFIHGFDGHLIENNDRLLNLNYFTLRVLALMGDIPYKTHIFPL